MPARTATRCQAEYDALARSDPADTFTHGLDDARTFVTEHRGERETPFPVGLADVGVADSGSDDPDEDLTPPGIPKLDLLDRVRFSKCVQDSGRGLHLTHSLTS